MKIAVISDTHNLLRNEVLEYLQGSDYILHGGDISNQEILNRLEEIAPVIAVRGGNHRGWVALTVAGWPSPWWACYGFGTFCARPARILTGWARSRAKV